MKNLFFIILFVSTLFAGSPKYSLEQLIQGVDKNISKINNVQAEVKVSFQAGRSSTNRFNLEYSKGSLVSQSIVNPMAMYFQTKDTAYTVGISENQLQYYGFLHVLTLDENAKLFNFFARAKKETLTSLKECGENICLSTSFSQMENGQSFAYQSEYEVDPKRMVLVSKKDIMQMGWMKNIYSYKLVSGVYLPVHMVAQTTSSKVSISLEYK
jgi:hypothetical protein